MNIVAYACSSRPNALWSAAQFEGALQKNRNECDIPLITKADAEAALSAKDAEIARLREVLAKIERVPAWGAPDKWETTPAAVRQLARAALKEKADA